MGLYAKIVQSPEYRDAKRGTVTGMLPELIGPNAPPMDLRFTGPDGTSYTTSHIILVSNNPYELRRMGGRGTRERLDLGVLGIAMARISNAAEFSRFLALEAAGRPQQYRGWLEWAATTFRVESNEPVEVGVDGEALVLDPPVVFESRPGVLRVRTPRRSIGRSPSARAVHPLSFWTVADLARVAAGSPAVGSRDQVVGEHDLDEADDRTDDHAE
jgi:diacylglycerol kinase family enzyme